MVEKLMGYENLRTKFKQTDFRITFFHVCRLYSCGITKKYFFTCAESEEWIFVRVVFGTNSAIPSGREKVRSATSVGTTIRHSSLGPKFAG